MNKNSDNTAVESTNETNKSKAKAFLKKAGAAAKTAAGYAASGAVVVGAVGLLALKTAVCVKYLRS